MFISAPCPIHRQRADQPRIADLNFQSSVRDRQIREVPAQTRAVLWFFKDYAEREIVFNFAITSTPVCDGIVKPATFPIRPATPATSVAGVTRIRTLSPTNEIVDS
jgi:hypothetical protein